MKYKIDLGKDKEFAVAFAAEENLELEQTSEGSFVATKEVAEASQIDEKFSDLWRYMSNELEWLAKSFHRRLDYLQEELSEHKRGHLPKIEGPGKMQQAIDRLGIGDDYEVQKRVIYARDGSKMEGLSAHISY